MRIRQRYCPGCGPPVKAGTCAVHIRAANPGWYCMHCRAVYREGMGFISDTPYLFCWNCVRTKKAFDPVAR